MFVVNVVVSMLFFVLVVSGIVVFIKISFGGNIVLLKKLINFFGFVFWLFLVVLSTVWFSLMLFIVNRKYKEDVRESNFFGKKK